MASPSFKVTRISEGPVKPASDDTPDHTLPLAWVDRYPTHRGLVESMHIFRSGADAAPGVIREALAKALTFFYPLSGRIVEQPEPEKKGYLAIRCTADGLYFAEAVAECSLEDVRFLERPLLLPKEDLVPSPGEDLWGVEPHNTNIMMQRAEQSGHGFAELQGDADLGGPGEAGLGRHPRPHPAPGVGGPVPDPPRPGGVDAHLPVRRGRCPRRDPRGAGEGADLLLPAFRPHRGAAGEGVPRHPVHRRRRVLRGGRGRVQPGGRAVPGAPAAAPQGGPRPLPRRGPLERRAAQHHHDDADHQIHVRRVRDGPPVQPRVGGRHGRGTVHQSRGRHGAGAPGADGEAGVGQGEVPEPEHQAGPSPGAPRAGAGLHRARLPHHLHRRAQDAVQGAQRQVLLWVRRAHGEALAVPHQGAEPGARRHGEALLLRQRAPPAEAGPGVLRQLHLPSEDVGHEQEGAGVVGDGGDRHDQGGEAEDGGGVLPVRQGGDAAGPLPDDLQLRVHLRLRLEQARVLRGGLRLRPAHVRRPPRQQRLHRLRRHTQGAAAARWHQDARQLRHQGALRRVRPWHEGRPALSPSFASQASRHHDETELLIRLFD